MLEQKEMTEEQLKNMVALYAVLMDKFNPEFVEIKKLIDMFLPFIEYGEINATFYVKDHRIWRVEGFPKVSKIVK